MMFFATPERQAALRAAFKARAGTPFMEGIGKPGVGYDCAHLVRDCYAAAGVDFSPLDTLPQVSLRHGLFHAQGNVLDLILSHPVARRRLQVLDADERTQCGDLLGIRQYVGCNHLAVADGPDWAWHVPVGGRVTRDHISLFTIAARFRLKEDA